MESYKRYRLIEYLWIFYTSAYYLLWASSLKTSFPSALAVLKAVQILTIACLAILLLFKKMRRKDFFIRLGLVALIMVLEIVNSNTEFLTTIMFILCADSINFEHLIKTDIKVKTIWLGIIVMLGLLGILINIEGYYYNGDYKMALGFQHPNTLGAFVIVILLEWLIIQKNRSKKFRTIAAAAILGTIAWYVTFSKASFYVFAVIIVLDILTLVCPQIFKKKASPYLFSSIPIIVIILSIVLTKLYIAHDIYAITLNKALSGRLHLQALFWQQFPITLFGQNISSLDKVLDSGYIRCILQYGVIFTALLCASYTTLLYKLVKLQEYELAFFILFFVIYGFAETSILRLPINISLISLVFHKIYINTDLSAPAYRAEGS